MTTQTTTSQVRKSLEAFQDTLADVQGVMWRPASEYNFPEFPVYYRAHSTCNEWQVRYWPGTKRYLVALKEIVGYGPSVKSALKDIRRQVDALQAMLAQANP